MSTRPVLAVAFVVLLATAGCQAPVSPQSTDAAAPSPTTDASGTTAQSTTPGDGASGGAGSSSLVSVDGELAFNATKTYYRVGRLLDVPMERRPGTSVTVRDPPEGGSPGVASTSGFVNLVGIVPPESAGESGGVVTGAYAQGTAITLFDHPNASARHQENVLAHEFVHVYQTDMRPVAAVRSLDRERARGILRAVMVEGSAEYVQERYAVRYQNATPNQTEIPAEWKNASAYARWRVAPYEYGSRYFAMRVDDPAAVRDVYRNPPRTTEQVIHGYAPHEEQTADLSVDAEDADSAFSHLGGSTRGELFTRIALSTELSWERAADAAAGWGMDELLFFSGDGGADAYAWAIRFDSPGEADEFRAAFADYAAAKETAFRADAVGDESVVVFAGADSFVENASATGTSGNVTVVA